MNVFWQRIFSKKLGERIFESFFEILFCGNIQEISLYSRILDSNNNVPEKLKELYVKNSLELNPSEKDFCRIFDRISRCF